jgi:hypothetical protein
MIRRANSGTHQKRWRVDCSSTDDDPTLRTRLANPFLAEYLYSDSTMTIPDQSVHKRTRLNRQVLSTVAYWVKEGRRRTVAHVILDGELVEARDALLLFPVKVPGRIATEAGGVGRLDHRQTDRAGTRMVAYAQLSSHAMVLRGTAAVVFGLFEVRQDIVVTPTFVTKVVPMVEARSMPANVYRGINGTCAA